MKHTPTSRIMCSPEAASMDWGYTSEAGPERRTPRVALLIESSRSYGRGILRGIADYLKVYGPWSIFHEERSLGDVAPPHLIDCAPMASWLGSRTRGWPSRSAAWACPATLTK